MSNTKEREALADECKRLVSEAFDMKGAPGIYPPSRAVQAEKAAHAIIDRLASLPPEQAAQPERETVLAEALEQLERYEYTNATLLLRKAMAMPPEQEAQQVYPCKRLCSACVSSGRCLNPSPVDFSAPKAEQAAQVQEPLSDERIRGLRQTLDAAASLLSTPTLTHIVRAVERAHGIGVQLTKEGGNV